MIIRPSAHVPGGRLTLRLICVMLLAVLLFDAKRVSAEETWQPTISTTAGDDVVRRVVAPAPPLPQWNDPRYRRPAPPIKSHQAAPKREKWVPIVTGALPAQTSEEDAGGAARARVAQGTSAGAPAPAPGGSSAPTGAQDGAPARAPTPGPAGQNVQPPLESPDQSAAQPRQRPLEALPPDATAAQQYCFNTADSAADARFAWQAKKIKEMEAELEKRAVELEAKTEEYKKWLARRDEFSRKAQEKLVAFYAKMRPDAAASHLIAMDDETAAALLTKLEPKVASVVMAEITPEKAAKIAAIISGAAKIPPVRRPKPRTQGRAKPPEGGNAPAPPSRTRS